MKDNTKCFTINEIDINKIRLSEKKLYSKKHNSYKYYVLYEHDNEYISLRVTLKDVVGYYSVYNDNKKMNFSVNNEFYDKLLNILEHTLLIFSKLLLLILRLKEKGESTLQQQYLVKHPLKKTLSLL